MPRVLRLLVINILGWKGETVVSPMGCLAEQAPTVPRPSALMSPVAALPEVATKHAWLRSSRRLWTALARTRVPRRIVFAEGL